MKKYSKFLAFLLVFAIILPGFAQAAPVANETEYRTVIDLNLRTKDDDTASPVIFVPEGSKVLYTGKTTKNGYFSLSYQGKEGYALRGNVTSEENYTSTDKTIHDIKLVEEANGKEFKVVQNVSLRTGNSDQYRSLVLMARDGMVTHLGTTANGWFKVSYNETIGYVYRGDVTSPDTSGDNTIHDIPLVEPANGKTFVAIVDLALRTGNAKQYKTVGFVERGEEVTHLGTTANGWFKLKNKAGEIGYAYRGDVTSKANYDDLHEDESSEELAAAVAAAEEAIAALPTVEEVAIADKDAVAETKALVAAVKELDKEAAVEGEELIAELEAKIVELETAVEELAAATEAVEKAEESMLQEDVDSAQALVDALENKEDKAILQERLDAVQAEIDALEVKSVSAIDATTVEVEFAEALEEDFELEGKEINVGEMVATYVDGTYDAEAKTAQFKLAGEDKLVDAQEYVVTSDWTTDETFVARVEDEYVATVEITTTGVQAIEDAKVYFEATNQYGEALELTEDNTANLGAKVRVNGVPLLDDEVVYVEENDFVTISKLLKADDTLAVQITNEINEEDVVVGEKTFTVVKAEPAVPTTIGNLKATDAEDKEVTSLAAGDVVTLTVEVLDQYGNPYAAVEDEEYVRWVLELGTDLVTATFGDGEAELEFAADEAGAIKIVAYLANGQNVAYEATIGAAKLETLEYVGTQVDEGFNHEEKIIAQVKANTGAALTPDMLNFEVKALDKDTTAEDIEVYAALRKDVEKPLVGEGSDIVIVAKTSKVGAYEITPYVGLAFDDEDAVAADNKLTFETIVNQEVAKIQLGEFKANSLTENGKAKVDVVFTNKHGEVVKAPTKAEESVGSLKAITNTAVVSDWNIVQDEETKAYSVELTAGTKGTTSFKLNEGTVESNAIQVTVVDAAKLTTVELGARITEGVIAGDEVDFLRVVEIKDQYGNDYIPELSKLANSTITWTGGKDEGDIPTTATFKYYELNAKDEVVAQDDKDDNTKGVVLAIQAPNAENAINRVATITLKDSNETDAKVLDTLAVTIQPVRKLTSVTLVPTEATLSEGATTTIVVETKDQYGDITPKTEDFNVTYDGEVVTINELTEKKDSDDAEKLINYEFSVTGKKAGTAILTVGTDKVNAKVTITVEKAEAGIIDEIRLESKDLDDDGNYKYLVEATANNTVEFDVKTLKDGKVVTLNADPTAIASDDKVTANVVGGKLTVTIGSDFAIEDTKTEKEVTVTLRQLGVTTSIDLVVSKENAKLNLDTVKAYVKDGNKDVEIDLAEVVEVKETQDIIFHGVDQYGTKTFLDVNKVENLNESIIGANFAADGTLEVTGLAKGNATINLLDANLKTLFTVKVNVTEAAQ